MAEQVNLRIARQGWDAWNAHDVEGWLKILDEKHVWETDTLPAPVNGRDAAGQTMRMYITAFPDLRFSVDQLLPSEDYVVTRYTATGTHRGDLMGIPPTNRRAETHGCTIAEIKNGKIVHTRVFSGTPGIFSGNSASCPPDSIGWDLRVPMTSRRSWSAEETAGSSLRLR